MTMQHAASSGTRRPRAGREGCYRIAYPNHGGTVSARWHR
jgi:hypothetical protein